MNAIRFYRGLVEVASVVHRHALKVDSTDTGFYTCLWERKVGGVWTLVAGFSVGQLLTAEKWVAYNGYANEKAVRLGSLPEHISSFQSRNDDASQWPGAVLWLLERPRGAVHPGVDQYICSTSGLHWKFDEVLSVAIGMETSGVTIAQARAIASVSDNEHLTAYLDAYESDDPDYFKVG